MRVLILGKGGREHALAWKFSKSHRICGLFTAPGNAGTAEIGENIPALPINDPEAVVKECREKKIDLVFVGPEDPLSFGIVDALTASGIAVLGPNKRSAALESSKAFSKQFMQKHRIPTARAKVFTHLKDFSNYINKYSGKMVIKKNGLAAGKGVLESDNKEELLKFGEGILKSDSLLVEEYLEGYEITLLALTDGKSYILLPPCADFKKAKEGDRGANSGGMGAICPVPGVDKELLSTIERSIVKPTFDGIAREKLQYRGVLYFGLMITQQGPKLLEYNVRFGDPEAQVLLPVIKTDFADLCHAMINGKLNEITVEFNSDYYLGIVVASQGYPGVFETGKVVAPISALKEKEVLIFHSSTTHNSSGDVVTGGGRCFTVVGIGETLLAANKSAYEAAPLIIFEGSFYRKDIGLKFFPEIED